MSRKTSSSVGVLALHGDVAEHLAMLSVLHVSAIEVRTPEDLSRVDRLIIPGGESTVICRLLRLAALDDAISSRHREGTLPLLGT